jgi:hypothetical protein
VSPAPHCQSYWHEVLRPVCGPARPGGRAARPRAAIAEDRATIWRYGADRGEAMTLATALEVVQRAAWAGWFPAQAGITDWMGDTRLPPRDRTRVSPSQITALAAVLETGAAIRCNNLPALAWTIDRLLDDAARLAAMRANARRLGRPHAVQDIAGMLEVAAGSIP